MAAVGSEEVRRLRDAVARRIGLWFDDARTDRLAEALERRGDQADAWLARLEGRGPARAEVAELARELTVGETYFFRNVEQFRALSECVLPARIAARAPSQRLRLLSAGCASGEEAYSLAITVAEAVGPGFDAAVRAVDVNPAAIERARQRTYSSWALRETPGDAQRRWFRAERNHFRLVPPPDVDVAIEERNLLEDDPVLWAPTAYDVVFCRNVLMYFTPEVAVAVVARITTALAPGGYLFLGHAETLRGLSHDYQLHHTHGTFYYQKRPAEPAHEGPSTAAGAEHAAVVDADTSWVDAIQRASARIDALVRTVPEAPAPVPEAQTDPADRLLRAALLTQGGRLAEAEAVCRDLVARDDLDAGAHHLLALCREGQGDPAGAVHHDQVAAYLDPGFAMPRLHLGLLARRAGDPDTARRELGQALVLLQREDPLRILLFGGGFGRDALVALCRAELAACGGRN